MWVVPLALAPSARSKRELHHERLPSQDWASQLARFCGDLKGGTKLHTNVYRISHKAFLMAPVPLRPYFTTHLVLLSFYYRHNVFFFMRSSSKRSRNYATKMACILLLSTSEEQRSGGLVRFVWAKGHNPSEIHRDMYGENFVCVCSNANNPLHYYVLRVPCRADR